MSNNIGKTTITGLAMTIFGIFVFAQNITSLPVWNQYKSDLIRCVDANNLPCGTTTTGNDTLVRGKAIVSKNGDVFIKIKGAGAEKTYRAFWAQLNGGLTATSPASVSFTFIGSLFTDEDGNASGYFSGTLTGVTSSIGYIIIDDGLLNHFASGILTP